MKQNQATYNAGLRAAAASNNKNGLSFMPPVQFRKLPFMSKPVTLPGGVFQLMDVTGDDIGNDFNIIIYRNGNHAVGTLVSINGRGWYTFRVNGHNETVRGKDNILSEVMDESSSVSDNSDNENSDYYDDFAFDTDQNEFDIMEEAEENNMKVKEVMMGIRNSFREAPRTIRLHYPFGSKTIAKGNQAFDTPDETNKEPQAMVSYRAKDYEKHGSKVGKDYDKWAMELSDDSEDEDEKQERATRMLNFLEGNGDDDFDDMSERGKIAMGGLLSVGLISDPLRTQFDTTRTENDFFSLLRERESGNIGFRDMFGDKNDSLFYPARKSGSSQQREKIRLETELQDEDALWQNNCLINAICQAAHGRNATMMELLTIRINLGNVGQMMVASPHNIGVIRNALQINNQVVVHYRTNSHIPNETIIGIWPVLHIYHNGNQHFIHNPGNLNLYK